MRRRRIHELSIFIIKFLFFHNASPFIEILATKCNVTPIITNAFHNIFIVAQPLHIVKQKVTTKIIRSSRRQHIKITGRDVALKSIINDSKTYFHLKSSV